MLRLRVIIHWVCYACIEGHYIDFHDNDPIFELAAECTNKGHIMSEKNAQ